jgi:hypothetical protein
VLINLRGTNASGKSTAIRALLEKSNVRPIFGTTFGLRCPEGYKARLPQVEADVFVLGPYTSKCGGCDRIQPYDLIIDLLNKYEKRGDVLFEGSLISDNYGRIGEWLEARGRNANVLFLTTPLDVCLSWLRQRTPGGGTRHVEKRFQAIKRVRQKFIAGGKVRVIDTSPERAHDEMLKLLKEACYCGSA